MKVSAEGRLFESAARPFSRVGIGPWVFARVKFCIDPVYKEILKQGILPSSGRIIDLGCGQALTLSAIRSAQRLYEKRDFPKGWQPPPRDVDLCGFDISQKQVSIAQKHFPMKPNPHRRSPERAAPQVSSRRHPRRASLHGASRARDPARENGTCDRKRRDDRRSRSRRERRARFQCCPVLGTLRARLRGQWRQRFHYRSADDWARRIAGLGFETRIQDMGGRTPFRNILVHGVRASS